MKLWTCTWYYPISVLDLNQYRKKEIIVESETEETIRMALDMWAEEKNFQLLDLKIKFLEEIDV